MVDEFSELDVEIEGTAASQRVGLSFKKADAAEGTRRELDPEEIAIDFTGLLEDELRFDLQSYGNRLQRAVFGPPGVHYLFAEAMSARPLRIRLRLRTDDPALHAIRWELMTGNEGAALSTRQGLAFSRFHASGREVNLRPSSEQLRALVAVVNPTQEQQESFGLEEIETNFERRASALGAIRCDPLTGEQGQGQVTMNRLMAALREGEEKYGRGYDILYLVCHGMMSGGKPHLLFALETPAELANKSLFRSGEHLTKRMVDELVELPRLVVLASCAGAGTGAGDALAATGPLLAKIGIPAVMAMQGFIKIDTVEALLPAFFAEFDKTGAVDRAMQVARSQVRNYQAADDWWAPVLFMRLENGRLVYQDQAETSVIEVPQDTAHQNAAHQNAAYQNAAQKDATQIVAPADRQTLPKPEQLNMATFDRVALFKAMSDRLNLKEVQNLAFIMNIDYEDLAGSGKMGKVREFIEFCQRRGRIEELLDALASERPEWDWYTEAGVR
jgi:hypothetical protein